MVSACGVTVILAKVGKHRLQDPPVDRGCGVVIHVDGQIHVDRSLTDLTYCKYGFICVDVKGQGGLSGLVATGKSNKLVA